MDLILEYISQDDGSFNYVQSNYRDEHLDSHSDYSDSHTDYYSEWTSSD